MLCTPRGASTVSQSAAADTSVSSSYRKGNVEEVFMPDVSNLPEPVELIDADLDVVAGGMSARGEFEEEMHESAQAHANENPRG